MLLNNKYKVALIDIDDTVADFLNPLMCNLNELTGKNIHWKEWSHLNLSEIYDISIGEFYECLSNGDILDTLPVTNGAYTLISTLKKLDYEINFVTARAWHPNGYEVTKNWLERNGLHFDKITITKFKVPKIDYVRHMYPKGIKSTTSFYKKS